MLEGNLRLLHGEWLVARNKIPIALALGATLWLARPSQGQQSTSEDAPLQRELQRLGVVAEALDHSLPSLSCQESALSERIERGKVKQHVAVTATMRAVRIPGGPLRESVTVTAINGKPSSGKDPRFPFYTAGGFDSAMVYFMPAHQACYSFSLAAGRIDFETAADVESHPQCRNDELHGFALLDADGNVTHMERTVPAPVSRDFHRVPFAAIDFAPVNLNGQVFRLSSHLVSEYPEGDSKGQFEATYSDCKLFSVSVTIGPATPVDPDSHGSGAQSGPPNP
jgi:hypothetical protein